VIASWETYSPYGRANCPTCGREMNLRKNGTIRIHKAEPGKPWDTCRGSGRPPTQQ
jgi:hypothetical protein